VVAGQLFSQLYSRGTPRAAPNGRFLAHPVLIADDWRQSERRDRDNNDVVCLSVFDRELWLQLYDFGHFQWWYPYRDLTTGVNGETAMFTPVSLPFFFDPSDRPLKCSVLFLMSMG
jgi:hypothetical protein